MKKKIVFLSIIISIIVISAFFLYSTYATDPVPSNDSYAITLSGDTTVNIPRFSYKDIIYQIKNTTSGTVNYGVGYTSTTGNSVVYIWSDSTDPATGTIEQNNYKYVKLRIENNGNDPDTVTLSTILGYENGGELIVPNSVTIVTEKIYKVTFDANGGNTPIYSKGVKQGDTYGNLPTPTRDGYTFLGWNGINIFNPRKMKFSNSSFDATTEELLFNNGVYDRIMKKTQWTPKASATYTTVMQVTQNTFDNKLTLRTDDRFYIEQFNDAINNMIIVQPASVQKYVFSFTTRNDFSNVTLGSFWFYTDKSVTGNFKVKFAIYEGTGFDSWEPYFITSTTPVTQEKEHTLTAIWEENNS